jgi:hypothetical protein
LKEAIIEEAGGMGNGFDDDAGYGAEVRGGKGSQKSGGKQPKSQPSRTAPIETIYSAPHAGSGAAGKKNPPSGSSGGGGGGGGGGGAGSKGVVKRLRAKTQVDNRDPRANEATDDVQFHISKESDDANGRRNPVNFDELISNFEGGVTLQRLRKELEASKQSMKNSENFMKQLSREYLNGK